MHYYRHWTSNSKSLALSLNKYIFTDRILIKPNTLLLLHYIHLMAFFSRTTWVSWHQKGKPCWILLKWEMMGWQWHQLDHTQIICTSLQTDNHASTSPPSFLQAGSETAYIVVLAQLWHNVNTSSCRPTNSAKAFLLFWNAPLGVRRHQPPHRAVLSQIDCFVQYEDWRH